MPFARRVVLGFAVSLLLALAGCSSAPSDTADAAAPDTGTPPDDAAPAEPCSNGVKDGTETDVDCGGGCAAKCKQLQGCAAPGDCEVGLLCSKNACVPKSATDGVKDGDETDVDCGGAAAPPCANGKSCKADTDCANKWCDGGVCKTPTSSDGVKNGTETDIDCGGGAPTNAPGCLTGKACKAPGDCESKVCTGNVCQAPTKTDGVRNGTETDIDCGGAGPTNAPRCATGKACGVTSDCDNVLCTLKVCAAPANNDGIKNGTETDIDCGGGAPTNAPGCDTTKACIVDGDCANNVRCTGLACQPPTAIDGLKNGTETDVDCGGGAPTNAPRCATTKACLIDGDCANNVRCSGAVLACQLPTAVDGLKNGTETDVDCGGGAPTNAPRCITGKKCGITGDCDKVLCTALVCAAPANNDGIKNGTETDIDCGGGAPTNAPKCTVDKACLVAGDCRAGACSPASTCAVPSCSTAETAGINTCGAKENGQVGVAHESCCKSLVLPNRTTRRLDKYEITAGRFRNFLTAAGPDLRTWVTNYKAANPASQIANLVNMQPTILSNIYPDADRWDAMSLTTHLSIDTDDYGGIRGCYNGAGNYSANVYWQDHDHLQDYGLPDRIVARDESDQKSMNCVMPIMFVAFCAWDGGELATLADYHDPWTSTYPWGAADILRPNYNWCNGPYGNGGWTCQNTALTVNPPNIAGAFYFWPLNIDSSKDNESLIAAPGRFPLDATSVKSNGESWMDMFANMAEYTGDFTPNGWYGSNFCDTSVAPPGGVTTCTEAGKGTGRLFTNIPSAGIIGQSWEGHPYGRGSANAFPVTFQYGKFGGRCVRPATSY